jgi:membrane protein implicated in regulation of membrane protease activity
MTEKWREVFASRKVWAFAGATAIAIAAIGLAIVPGWLRSRDAATFARANVTAAIIGERALPASRNRITRFQGGEGVSLEAREAPDRRAMSAIASSLENDDSSQEPPPSAAPSPQTVGPMIVQTASLSIVANNYDESSGAIEKLVLARGGYVEKLDAKAVAGNAREINVTLRIPAKQLGDFLGELRKLGHVAEETQSNEEVSAEYVDLQARLRSAQATERRLIELLQTRTGKLEDVLDAERELARVRSDIESMQGQSAVLVHRVSYASVDVDLSEEYHEKLHSDSSTWTKLRNAAVNGLQNLEEGVIDLLVFGLNYGLSILFWLAALLVPAWLVWRRFRIRSVRSNGGTFQTP